MKTSVLQTAVGAALVSLIVLIVEPANAYSCPDGSYPRMDYYGNLRCPPVIRPGPSMPAPERFGDMCRTYAGWTCRVTRGRPPQIGGDCQCVRPYDGRLVPGRAFSSEYYPYR